MNLKKKKDRHPQSTTFKFYFASLSCSIELLVVHVKRCSLQCLVVDSANRDRFAIVWYAFQQSLTPGSGLSKIFKIIMQNCFLILCFLMLEC